MASPYDGCLEKIAAKRKIAGAGARAKLLRFTRVLNTTYLHPSIHPINAVHFNHLTLPAYSYIHTRDRGEGIKWEGNGERSAGFVNGLFWLMFGEEEGGRGPDYSRIILLGYG